ncbi:hypothetical protein LTR37_002802 [Vermiconidia calcicola]|uniref:Uncharacterized protein n=1 Tax=Vermiconidia calcicola TaxID=1690605 RepID=A0ACC3NS85_9PEZI|nr:hypothetical protein LTR37_002802 [Vermiconidia calcicola]
MGQTKSSSLEFLNRVRFSRNQGYNNHAAGEAHDGEQGEVAVNLEEVLFLYPSSMPGSPEQLREKFIKSILRTKSRAQRQAVIAIGLLPISAFLFVVCPVPGIVETNAVWAFASVYGAKTSRSMSKRLTRTARSDTEKNADTLHLTFTPSPRLAILEKYLAARCHKCAADLFPSPGEHPTESEVLEAIGWSPSLRDGEGRDSKDEQWEISEVKNDLRSVLGKGSKEWAKWCRLYEKRPGKAIKK